jgi:HK97 gp10 family phage protein
MKPGADVQGVEEVQRNMKKLAKLFSKATVEGAVAFGELVRAEAIQSIQDQSPGEAVERVRAGGSVYSHITSAEGDAPNTDTGRLVQSIQVDVQPTVVFVGSTLYYAGFLENGTRRMPARPWLFPALENNKAAGRKLIGQKIKKVTLIHGDV